MSSSPQTWRSTPLVVAILVVVGVLAWWTWRMATPATPPDAGNMNRASSALRQDQAKGIAQSGCLSEPNWSLKEGTYNAATRTWWFDLQMPTPRAGCSPACVVSESTRQAEINWRCTGLIPPPADGEAAERIRQAFAVKYPPYASTLGVRIEREEDGYVRGSVWMQEGQPGALFFARRREDGTWTVAHDGNGPIPCTLSQQGFPASFLTDCAR